MLRTALIALGLATLMASFGCIQGHESARPAPAPTTAGDSPEAIVTDPSQMQPVPATEPYPDGPNAQKEFTTTPSGLKYRILREGTPEKAGPQSYVNCHYKGWLDDGTVFDSTYARDKSAIFNLNNVIPGWTEGLQLVGATGKIELDVPYQLGYGELGNVPSIPPKSNLHFIVEVVEIR